MQARWPRPPRSVQKCYFRVLWGRKIFVSCSRIIKNLRKLTCKLKLSANSTVKRDQFSSFWWQFVVWTSKKAGSRVSRSKGVIWGQIIDRKKGFIWLIAAWAMKPSGFMYFGKSPGFGIFFESRDFYPRESGFLCPGFGIFSLDGISRQKANSAIPQNLGLWFWTVQLFMIEFY